MIVSSPRYRMQQATIRTHGDRTQRSHSTRETKQKWSQNQEPEITIHINKVAWFHPCIQLGRERVTRWGYAGYVLSPPISANAWEVFENQSSRFTWILHSKAVGGIPPVFHSWMSHVGLSTTRYIPNVRRHLGGTTTYKYPRYTGSDYSCNLRYFQSATYLATRSVISLLLSSAALISFGGDLSTLCFRFTASSARTAPYGLASFGNVAVKHATDCMS